MQIRYLVPMVAAVLTPGVLTAGVAQAQNKGVIYAGAAVGDGEGGYLGGLVALPGNTLGDGLAVRGGVNGGTYRYRTDQRIEATYVSAEVALVYQFSGEWGWANVAAGPRITDISLDPDDPGNKLRGTRFDAGVQTDGALGNQWQTSWFGTWGIRNEAYIGQLRLTRLISEASQTRVGVEGIVQGDPTYTRGSLGGHIATGLGGGWLGQFSAGASEQAGRKARPYAALGLSRLF